VSHPIHATPPSISTPIHDPHSSLPYPPHKCHTLIPAPPTHATPLQHYQLLMQTFVLARSEPSLVEVAQIAAQAVVSTNECCSRQYNTLLRESRILFPIEWGEMVSLGTLCALPNMIDTGFIIGQQQYVPFSSRWTSQSGATFQ
jgi:hypothetical protein